VLNSSSILYCVLVAQTDRDYPRRYQTSESLSIPKPSALYVTKPTITPRSTCKRYPAFRHAVKKSQEPNRAVQNDRRTDLPCGIRRLIPSVDRRSPTGHRHLRARRDRRRQIQAAILYRRDWGPENQSYDRLWSNRQLHLTRSTERSQDLHKTRLA
jgi:hypothetical protein